MNREEIDLKVISLVDETNADYYDDDDNPLYRKVDLALVCTEMAEWMQEQMIERARNTFCRYCLFDCEGHPHNDCTLLQEYIQTIKGER